jgi:hypothetical protein
MGLNPSFSFNDVPCCHIGNSELGGQLSVRESSGPCVSDTLRNLRRQFCKPMIFAPGPSAFLNRILHVVVVGSCKQMCRIYTGWIIALMQHIKSFWNRPDVKNPRDSMCQHVPRMLSAIQNAIAVCIPRSLPQPAALAFFNLRQKTPWCGYREVLVPKIVRCDVHLHELLCLSVNLCGPPLLTDSARTTLFYHQSSEVPSGFM